MKHGGPLKRKTPLSRGRKKKLSIKERMAKERFERLVLGLSGLASCVVCAAPAHDAHHVIAKQKLKALPGLGEDRIRVIWDPRNGVPVCRACHDLITRRMIRLQWSQLNPEIKGFIREFRLEGMLERELFDRGSVFPKLGVRRPVDGREVDHG